MATPGLRWGERVVHDGWSGHAGRQYEPRPASILQVLVEARRWADRPFIIYEDAAISFVAHERLVHHVARVLRDRGVTPGQRVGIFAANRPEWVAAFFAVIAVGAVAVPFNRWWAAEEVGYATELADTELVITDDDRSDRVPDGISRLMISELGSPTPSALPWTDADPWAGADESAPAVILFTAGTTAFPKGVVLSHRALISNLQTLLGVAGKLPHQIDDGASPSVTLVGLPLFHIGAIQLVLVPLMTGGRIVFAAGRFSAADVLRLIDEHGVTMFSGVPTMMERMLREADASSADLRTVRTIILGGAPVEDRLLARIQDAFPNATRGVGRTYGLTETGGVVSTGAGGALAARPGSSGRLAPVVEVRIDGSDGAADGEILVRSPAAMSGYLGDEDTGLDAEGWFRTGDLGHVDDDGYLYVTGRAKDVIIRGGENVSVARVEEELNRHPDVLEVCVLGLPDQDLGEVVGAVVQRRGDTPDAETLRAFAERSLARFEIPARWWFRDQPLPTNAAGKVLRAQLRADWLSDGGGVDRASR